MPTKGRVNLRDIFEAVSINHNVRKRQTNCVRKVHCSRRLPYCLGPLIARERSLLGEISSSECQRFDPMTFFSVLLTTLARSNKVATQFSSSTLKVRGDILSYEARRQESKQSSPSLGIKCCFIRGSFVDVRKKERSAKQVSCCANMRETRRLRGHG